MSNVFRKIVSIMCLILLVLLIFQLPVLATNSEDKIIIQKTEEKFLIYYKDICNDEFNFAFSKDENEDKDNLIFISSVKDQLQSEYVNVAYIDSNIYNNYFTTDQKAYIWIKNTDGTYLIEADEIDLNNNVLTDEQIEFVDNTTKRIDGQEENSSITNMWTDENDVKHTVILSQYVITKEENTNYYYQIVKIPKGDTTSKAAQLYDLASKLENGINDKYEQFKTQQKFYNLYQELQPNEIDSGWKVTEDGCILEPEDTITGDKYIIWLKADQNGEITQDAKFLVCNQEEKEEKIKFTPMEVVKLPKTFDSIALLVIFVIIVVAIIIVMNLKNKENDNN